MEPPSAIEKTPARRNHAAHERWHQAHGFGEPLSLAAPESEAAADASAADVGELFARH
jgi:hypothetical protein